MLKKSLIGFGAVVVLLVVGFVVLAQVRGGTTWEDTPYPSVSASTDPEVIARGEYLVHALMHCPVCHLPFEEALNIRGGDRPAMVGGGEWKLPFGVFRSANITSDEATGIGGWTDGELARVIQTGVGPDGRLSILMALSVGEVAPDDLRAVVSYLRSTAPVSEERSRSEANLLGKALFGGLPPTVRSGRWTKAPPSGPTVERGEYLARGPAYCYGCHSAFDMKTLTLKEPYFVGSAPEPAKDMPGIEIVAPNLTPDPETGWITAWTEDEFVARLRAGRTVHGSKMPWESYANMTEDDGRAIYRYLRTLPPVVNDLGPTVRKTGWTASDG